MSEVKRKYTTEFKQGALELAEQLGNVAEAARKLGISDSLIYSWRGRVVKASEVSPATPTLASPSQITAEELARLRRENQELKKVNQILKAAAAFFSQDHLK